MLHGDLHHDNVLRARREPWLAIDPHGVVGDPGWGDDYELAFALTQQLGECKDLSGQPREAEQNPSLHAVSPSAAGCRSSRRRP